MMDPDDVEAGEDGGDPPLLILSVWALRILSLPFLLAAILAWALVVVIGGSVHVLARTSSRLLSWLRKSRGAWAPPVSS